MLTTDLVRATVRNGVVLASYLNPRAAGHLALAEEMVLACTQHVGRSMGELHEAMRDIEGASPRYKIARGLAKVLVGRLEVVTSSPSDPVALRRAVFEHATTLWTTSTQSLETLREEVLASAAARLNATPEAVERGLYADLKDAQQITSFKALEPVALLHRYNLALAQTILLKADRLELTITQRGELAPNRFRQLFRYLKFYRLLHTIEKTAEGYRIVVDGPMSIFDKPTAYGFQMACFLPALLLCEDWKMVAHVRWGKQRTRCIFELDATSGLVSHLRDRGVYLTDEQRHFVQRFEALGSPWRLSSDEPLLLLGGQSLWIPDFRFTHTEDGREAHLETLGYWRADYLRRRVALLAEHGPPNLILAISEKMRVDKETVSELPVRVIWYKKTLRPKLVAAALDEVAR